MSNQIETKYLGEVIKNHTQDMTGKVVVITGTTSGTGYVCAKEVAKKGATVVLLNRKSERSENSLQKLKTEFPDGNFDQITCDLQSFESVRKASESIKNKYDVIDVLVNNAGVMALPDQPTPDGYDVQMQTNVLSHFLLTKELFPLIKNSKEGRIVNHSSMARLGPPLANEYFEKKGGKLGGDGTEEENFGFSGPRWARYHQTKLANAAFTYGLKQKLEAANVSNVIPLLAHPGLAKTELAATSASVGGMDDKSDFMKMAQSAEDGATGIIRAAMDPKAKPGDFYGPSGEGWNGFPDSLTPEDILLDETNLKVNWEGCEKAVGPFEL
jgi:NAD(P)-dependent dehydrogenase (short-subunit alcohol dehydrogenase family)